MSKPNHEQKIADFLNKVKQKQRDDAADAADSIVTERQAKQPAQAKQPTLEQRKNDYFKSVREKKYQQPKES